MNNFQIFDTFLTLEVAILCTVVQSMSRTLKNDNWNNKTLLIGNIVKTLNKAMIFETKKL